MQIFRSIQEIPAHYGPSVVTVGNFDGVHRGHRTVIANVIDRARELHARSVAVTFDPHPVRVLRPQSGLRLITLPGQKLSLLEQTGIDAVLVLPFTPEMSRWSAQEFASRVLCEALGAVEVQEGENFRFGADAGAGVNDLAALGATLGFQARVHHPTVRYGMEVSSSAVRNAIAQGNMRVARHLLGRPFEIWSSPAPGRGYGSRYTVPTINLADYSELVPANGVYITCIDIDGETFDSVTNVGNRPTFGDPSFAIETHLLNFHPLRLTEHTPIHLRFLDRIRPEKQWTSPEALKQQIALDVARTRRYFALQKALVSSPA
jgi:riboflavin kinase/FMN adenylyltransferase